jgi:predicted RNase H-like HicB family nuclease
MKLTIESEQEVDGRWLAEVIELPGVMAYGKTDREAVRNVLSLTLRVLADRIEHGEPIPTEADEIVAIPFELSIATV